MGLGILEPKRQETHVPATAVLLQADRTALKVKDEIVLVPRPSNSPRDPLVGVISPLHEPVGFITYVLDRIGRCGRKTYVSLPYAYQSQSLVFKVAYCKQSMGSYKSSSGLRSQKLNIYHLTYHSRVLSRVSFHRFWLA